MGVTQFFEPRSVDVYHGLLRSWVTAILVKTGTGAIAFQIVAAGTA